MVDFTKGTPLELTDGTPVSFVSKSINPFASYKYTCLVHRPGSSYAVAFRDDGSASNKSLHVKNVYKQTKYLVSDPNNGKVHATFYDKTLALTYAGNARPQPWRVEAVTVGEYGKIHNREFILG